MTQYLILNNAQVVALCGSHDQPRPMDNKPWLALRPILLADGTRYVLPASLLNNPDFAEVHDQLATYPIAEVADDEFSGAGN